MKIEILHKQNKELESKIQKLTQNLNNDIKKNNKKIIDEYGNNVKGFTLIMELMK